MKTIRKAVFSGSFYPSETQDLKNQLAAVFHNIPLYSHQNIKGLICPHAGIMYSGRTAAYSFSTLKNEKPENIVIIGPSHSYAFNGISVLNADAYETPLGLVPVNRLLTAKLLNSYSITYKKNAHCNEHSIEVLLPFLQYCLSDSFSVTGIVMGSQSDSSVIDLSKLLIENCDIEKTLIIASSDFSHFYTAQQAQEMDKRALDLIKTKAAGIFYEEQVNKRIQCCGFGPILVLDRVMKAFNIANVTVRNYSHSGEVTGDMNSVVGYASVVYD